jgi:predicted RNA-binding protein with PIN domain
MDSLPDDVVRSIVKGTGAYMRQTKSNELPRSLRRFKNFTAKALAGHSAEILRALEDEALRAKILEWLEGKPGIAKSDATVLEIAMRRDGDWEATLTSRRKRRAESPRKQGEEALRSKAKEYKQRADAARTELKRARQEARVEAASSKRERDRLKAEIASLENELKAVRGDLTGARRSLKQLRDQAEREQRRARKQADRADWQQEDLKARVKELRSENSDLKRGLAEREPAKRTPKANKTRTRAKPTKREKLRAPKGLLDDAKETLEQWLTTPDLALVVDGYNVAKHEKGFSTGELESQRDVLVSELQRLSARYSNVSVLVVFDGSEVPPGSARRKKGRVKVEYSRDDEIADDHIVARVEELPPVPVIVATSDRELQERVEKLDATVATSPQLLEVIRKA